MHCVNFLISNQVGNQILPKIENKEMRLSEGKSDEEKLYKLFSSIYDIEKDDEVMRKILTYEPNEQAKYFDINAKKISAQKRVQ